MLSRLDEIETDLSDRRVRAEQEGRLGEIEGIDLILAFLRQKREESRRLPRVAPVNLGMPGLRPAGS
ncbi:recombinase [Streptomyces sp. NPDC059883]|uniref:recombinase n=1 Tax=unclassified Streptomyces TaxID=2593676 RepID=UPI0036531C28